MAKSPRRPPAADDTITPGGARLSFVDMLEQASALLERHQRLSLRALRLEFALSDADFEALIEELIDVQQVAELNGKVLSWVDPVALPRALDSPPAPETSPKQLEASAPTPGERRQLTVLFSDLAGSTQLAHSLDGEDLRDLLTAYHRIAAEVVAHFEGHIAEYLGDGQVAYFGFPRAREDDPERAVRAGLAIVAAVDKLNAELERGGAPNLAVRVGIHTGAVVVGDVGDGPAAQVRATGETLNIAARLQQQARPRTVVVSPATLRLAQGVFQSRDLGSHSIKGVGDMHMHEVVRVIGVRSRLDLGGNQPRTALIGRDREVGLLRDRWQQVQESNGKVMLISGEAGLGKSRLLRALRDQLADEAHSWLECNCSRDRRSSAYYPLVELMERGIGLQPDDPPETKLHKLEASIRLNGLSASETVPLLASVLSLPVPVGYAALHYSPDIRHRKTIEALWAWVLAIAAVQPVLMLVEDLHWCDPSTLDFLTLLIEQTPTAAVMTVLSYRPEFQPPWPVRSHLLHLEVCRLTLAQAEQLVASAARDRELPRETVDGIIARGDGVPLFLEELTAMAIDSTRASGADPTRADSIPATLNDLLMARLDRLGPGKRIAQLGAVLGRSFRHDLLQAIAATPDAELNAALRGLLDAELLYSRGVTPNKTYTFKHALVQDAAYQSLLRRDRRRIHAATAEALEQRFPDRAAAAPEDVARHYDEAGMADQAVAQYAAAARRAKTRFANQDVIAFLRCALQILGGKDPSTERDETELTLQLAIGTPLYLAHGWANVEYAQSLQRARELTIHLGREHELFSIWLGLYFHHQFAGDLTESEHCARRALACSPSGSALDSLVALSGLSQTLYLQGRFESALDHIEQLIERYYSQSTPPDDAPARTTAESLLRQSRPLRDLPSRNSAASALRGVRALCYWTLGYPDQAVVLCDSALASAREDDSPFNLASACIYSGWIHLKRRECAQAMAATQEAYDLCTQYGFSLLSFATVLHGCVTSGAGTTAAESERLIATMQHSIDSMLAAGAHGWLPHCYSGLAEVYSRLERPEDTLRAIESGLECTRQTAQRYEYAELLRMRGDAYRRTVPNDAMTAEHAFQQSLEVASQAQAKMLELRAATSLATLWLQQGRRTTARDLLQPIHGWFEEGLSTVDWRAADALMNQLA